MIHVNNMQYEADLEKVKPKMQKAIKAQRLREKFMIWVEVPNSIGNMRILKYKK